MVYLKKDNQIAEIDEDKIVDENGYTIYSYFALTLINDGFVKMSETEIDDYLLQKKEQEDKTKLHNTEEELLERQKQELRKWREKFFDVIDCAVWYDCLTDKEKQEVKVFRYALLDITQTLEKPTIPACVLERIKED